MVGCYRYKFIEDIRKKRNITAFQPCYSFPTKSKFHNQITDLLLCGTLGSFLLTGEHNLRTWSCLCQHLRRYQTVMQNNIGLPQQAQTFQGKQVRATRSRSDKI